MAENKETEESVYDEEGRDDLVEDGEISPEEEAFMQGYDEAEEKEEKEKEEKE